MAVSSRLSTSFLFKVKLDDRMILSLFLVQPLKDIHLVMCVAVFVVVDITILTISTSLSSTRLKPVVIPNKEGLTGEDVSVHYSLVVPAFLMTPYPFSTFSSRDLYSKFQISIFT